MLSFLLISPDQFRTNKKPQGVIPVVHMSAAHIHHRPPEGNLYFADIVSNPVRNGENPNGMKKFRFIRSIRIAFCSQQKSTLMNTLDFYFLESSMLFP